MKRITAWAAVLTLTLSLLTGCAQIDESSADELPFPSEERKNTAVCPPCSPCPI